MSRRGFGSLLIFVGTMLTLGLMFTLALCAFGAVEVVDRDATSALAMVWVVSILGCFFVAHVLFDGDVP